MTTTTHQNGHNFSGKQHTNIIQILSLIPIVAIKIDLHAGIQSENEMAVTDNKLNY